MKTYILLKNEKDDQLSFNQDMQIDSAIVNNQAFNIDKACSRIDPILTDTIGQSLESAFAADSSGTPFEFKTEVDVF